MNNESQLEFTGERFTPECEREIWYEHYHRYAFAKYLVAGKQVLDIASGEGYGSRILADYAATVVAVDIDAQSIEHAGNKYPADNLKFVCASCLDIPLADHSMDVIVSFETLEHLAEQQQMLAEFDRVLKPDGILIISTPDKKHYSDAIGFSNEFHVKELYKDEFRHLLDAHWSEQIWYSQDMSFNSVMQRHDMQCHSFSSDVLDGQTFTENGHIIKSMYYVVVACKSNSVQLDLPDLHLFADREQSIYGHYNAVIRAHIKFENKFNALNGKLQRLFSIPVIGKFIRLLFNRT